MSNYDAVFSQSINEPEKFWGEAAKGIDWYKECDKVLDSSNPPFYRWFRGGKMNTCYNAVDRHVAGGRRHLGGQVVLAHVGRWRAGRDAPVVEALEQHDRLA